MCRPEDAQVAWEDEGQRAYDAMGRFFDGIAALVRQAEADGLHMPALVTALRLEADELSDRFLSEVND